MTKSKLNLVFGAMTFGEEGIEMARVHDLETCSKILDAFTSRGYTEVDTARLYCNGTSEEYLAKLDWKSRDIVMETKLYPNGSTNAFGPMTYTHHKGDVRRGLLDSLKALNTDKIDMFYLHAPDRTVPWEETLREVNELHQEGYFNRFGISNYAAWEVVQICEICERNGWIKPTVYQGLYNAVARMVELELIPCLRKYGIAFYAFNPLAGGFLTDRYHRDTTEVEATSRFDPNRRQGQFLRRRYWNDYFFDALDVLRPVAKKHGLTEAECALRWIVHHSALKKELGDAVIFGASKLPHAESNLDDLEKGPLPDEVVEALDSAWTIIRGADIKYFH
ncbi:hypothetical protein ABW19_dt0200180 [Dactylella cylindrospora]|nr:hypothetical protein ABW19_dt0200180 [Dactylella cylindrospora]